MKNKIILLLLIATFFSSCSKSGFQSQLSSASNQTNNSSSDGSNTTTPPLPSIETLDLKSKVEDSSGLLGFNGNLAFDFDKTKGEFIIMVPMPSGVIFTGSGSFKNYPDIRFAPIFDATGRMKMAVRVPIKYILKGTTMIAPAKLPSGEDLPAMPNGLNEMPSLALQFPQNNNMQLSLYLGLNALGLYISLPAEANLPLMFNVTLPLKNKDKTVTSGYLTYVTAKNGYSSGLFVSTIVPAKVALILENYFHL